MGWFEGTRIGFLRCGCCLVCKSCSTLCDPMDCCSPDFCPWDFPGKKDYWSGLSFPSPGHLPVSGIKPTSPELAGGFFITEPPGKPLRSGGLCYILHFAILFLFVNICKLQPFSTASEGELIWSANRLRKFLGSTSSQRCPR